MPVLIVITAVEPNIKKWNRVIRGFSVEDPECLSSSQETSGLIPWGKTFVKRKEEVYSFFLCGNPGTGKSTFLEVVMSFAFKYIGIAPDRRGIVFDSKPDQSSGYVPFCEGMGGSYKILNPNDKRCTAWDIAKDVQNEIQANEASHIIVSDPKGQNVNEYFTTAARNLVAGAIFALIRAKGDTYTLRDLILVLTNKKDLRIILKTHQTLPKQLIQ